MSSEFHLAAVAGTFDRFHLGHQALLTKAFASAEKILLGITDLAMTQDKVMADIVLPYEARKKAVENFLTLRNWQDRCQIFPLHDIYGPAITEPNLEALVVSSKTVAGAEKVQQKRVAAGLSPLAIVVADYVPSEDASYFSSTRIRLGEINRIGGVYEKFLQDHAPFVLPLSVRVKLQQPLGPILGGQEDNMREAVTKAKHYIPAAELVYTVGDVVTETFKAVHIPIDLAVFDYRNKRKATQAVTLRTVSKKNWFMVTNEAGTISRSAINGLLEIKKHLVPKKHGTAYQLFVGGEEDLLVLPITLLAPLNSLIFYGQSGQGIVMVNVTEEQKEKTLQLLKDCLPERT